MLTRIIASRLFLVAAMTGIATPLEAGNKAGTITYQNLVPGGVAIVGVTSHLQGPTSPPESRGVMAKTFEEQFLMWREDIPLMGVDRVRSAVGPEPYEAMLDQVQSTGELSTPALASLKAALVDSVRYVVVARLERERVNRGTNEVDPDNDPDTKDSKIVNYINRIIDVTFRVYDLRDGTLAWNRHQTGTETRENSAPVGTTLFKSYTAAGILESVLSDEKGPPDPPLGDAFENLPGIFETFLKKLPKKK